MVNTEGNEPNRATGEVARARRPGHIDGLLATICLSYFAWLPTVASIGLGIGFLVSGEPIWFVLSTLVGLCAFLGWAVWYNVDR